MKFSKHHFWRLYHPDCATNNFQGYSGDENAILIGFSAKKFSQIVFFITKFHKIDNIFSAPIVLKVTENVAGGIVTNHKKFQVDRFSSY